MLTMTFLPKLFDFDNWKFEGESRSQNVFENKTFESNPKTRPLIFVNSLNSGRQKKEWTHKLMRDSNTKS